VTSLQQLTEHVYVFPTHPDKNKLRPAIGVICTPTQTVLYDAGNSPAHAREVLAELQHIDAPPVRYIIYSHVHWDHIFGAQVFDAPVIAHQRCAERVQETAQLPWGREYLEQRSQEKPYMAKMYTMLMELVEWDSFQVVHPSIVFKERFYTLHLDGVTLELEHVGGGHSDDSTIARVIEDRVMFLADSFYPIPPKLNGADFEMVNRFLAENYDYYVDGHNTIFSRQTFHRWATSPARTK
jgi:glyoxylase-like metal-dependent hydrolase (beta-lactamase superfamily II)